jgi:hypothetical protein
MLKLKQMKKMNGIKGFFFLLAVILLPAGCGKTKDAHAELEHVRTLYETGHYAAAKTAIDTLRLRYPREIDVLRDALTLMRLVERSESERNIAYCDSLTPIRAAEAEVLKKAFVFEKNEDYEDIGNYIWKQQTVERNVERSYIRCGVNETGEIYLASVYFGRRPIRHSSLKISTPDGAYATTASIPYDGGMNYRFTDDGNTTEVVTYRGDHCLEAVRFICNADAKARIKAEYTGGNAYALYLGENDRKAICTTLELAAVLNDLHVMQREKEKSLKRIAYLDSKKMTD